MKNKISFLALFAIALNVNYVCASECVDEECELTPVEITEDIDVNDVLEPVKYEFNWVIPTQTVCEVEQEICEYDYNCPFETPEECAIWYKKPAYKTSVAPRAPHINPVRVDDMIFAIYSNEDITANDPAMMPLRQRYTMLMNASDACCTSGLIYKMRQNKASDTAVYNFLKDDANRFAVTKRCLVMDNEDFTSRYSNGVNGKMVMDVRNTCLCKNHEWFDSLLQPFNDIYERLPWFQDETFVYSYIDGMGREISVSVNEDVQTTLELLKQCPR